MLFAMTASAEPIVVQRYWNLVDLLIRWLDLTGTASALMHLCGALICIIVPYLLGSINPAILISKTVYHEDIRDFGSGNAGTTNMLRTYGKKAAIATFALDLAKAAVAVILGKLIWESDGGALAGFFVMFGHMFPLDYRFRGGKGVAASIGILLMIDWRLVLIAGIPALLVMVISRMMSVASLTFETLCFVGLAVLCFHMDFYYGILLATFCYPAMSFWRHRSNLVRIAHGEESKLWGKGSKNTREIPKDQYEEDIEKLDEQAGVDMHHHNRK